MLNITSFNIGEITSKVSLNTPSTGIIQKSHPRSKFVRFHARSQMSEYVFSESPRLTKDSSYKIVVIQIMVFGNDELLVEYVYEEDLVERE